MLLFLLGGGGGGLCVYSSLLSPLLGKGPLTCVFKRFLKVLHYVRLTILWQGWLSVLAWGSFRDDTCAVCLVVCCIHVHCCKSFRDDTCAV